MAEGVVIVALIASSLAIASVSWLARLFARLAGFPFGAIHWFLHGLGFLVTLPFILALLVLTTGVGPATWWAGGAVLFAALVSFVGGAIQLVREVAHGRTAFVRH